MAYYIRDEQVWNSDDMWDILKQGGELVLPALVEFAFGGEPEDKDLLADLNQLRNHMPPEHELTSLVDGAIAILQRELQEPGKTWPPS